MKIQVKRFWRKHFSREFLEIVDRACCAEMEDRVKDWKRGVKANWRHCPYCGEPIEHAAPLEKEETFIANTDEP